MRTTCRMNCGVCGTIPFRSKLETTMQNLNLPWSPRKARLLCELLAEVLISQLSLELTAMTWQDYVRACRLCKLLGLQKQHLLELIDVERKHYSLVRHATMN